MAVDGRYFERTMVKNSSLVRGSSRKTPTIMHGKWMGSGQRDERWPEVMCNDADHHASDRAALRPLNAPHHHTHVSARTNERTNITLDSHKQSIFIITVYCQQETAPDNNVSDPKARPEYTVWGL